LLICADKDGTYVVTGTGDVLEPDHPVTAIGSGGGYALAAARALYGQDLDAEHIARKAMAIAADICVFTNGHVTLEQLVISS
jgi:ATP-dependent HslUV protease subunit HslV